MMVGGGRAKRGAEALNGPMWLTGRFPGSELQVESRAGVAQEDATVSGGVDG